MTYVETFFEAVFGSESGDFSNDFFPRQLLNLSIMIKNILMVIMVIIIIRVMITTRIIMIRMNDDQPLSNWLEVDLECPLVELLHLLLLLLLMTLFWC